MFQEFAGLLHPISFSTFFPKIASRYVCLLSRRKKNTTRWGLTPAVEKPSFHSTAPSVSTFYFLLFYQMKCNGKKNIKIGKGFAKFHAASLVFAHQ
jgi:hypothetical protein